MTGGHHLATGAASYLLLTSVPMASSLYSGPWASHVCELGTRFGDLYKVPVGVPDGNLALVTGFVVSVLMFALGLLLPDIDSQGSILGRFVYLPIKHRTWTHSVWPVFLFFVLAFFWLGFFWLAMGMTVHLLLDTVSVQGVCWFYPISKYRYYPSGAAVKKRHWLKLYRTGSKMEKVVCYAYIVICVGLFALVSVMSWHSVQALADISANIS